MIKIEGHPVSEMYARISYKSWKDLGYNVTFFNAVTPKDLVYRNELKFGKKASRNADFSPTEKAIWYSMYDLWVECSKSRESMIVLEHDSYLHRKLPNLRGSKFKFLSYIKREWKDNELALAPGSGYFITPESAKILISAAKKRTIGINSDGHVGRQFMNLWRATSNKVDNCINEEEVKKILPIQQINIDGWNTIDHNNPDNGKKFIGDNYEDFDIPSIHRQAI